MDDATRPDAGEEVNCAPLATKADQLLAVLAAGPCTLADLATVSRDPMACSEKSDSMAPSFSVTARPSRRYTALSGCRCHPPRRPSPARSRNQSQSHPRRSKAGYRQKALRPLTGLPAETLPLRWSAGKFPAAVVFKCLEDAAELDETYRPALAAMANGASHE